MPVPDAPRSIPTLKFFLFRAYVELKRVESEVYEYSWPSELSTLEKAIILLEDRRFFSHAGIDVRSWFREFYRIVTFQRHGGASTIEMQFVRTCTGYKERTRKRKLFEMYLALALTHRVGKLLVLRSYMQIAYFGTGLRGVDAASFKMFDVHPGDLSPQQAAVIASMLVYPRPAQPDEAWTKKIQKRSNYGLKLLAKHQDRYWK
jgi:membrane peptidoglycan carboxypeptidase